jgi:hypothetical protein
MEQKLAHVDAAFSDAKMGKAAQPAPAPAFPFKRDHLGLVGRRSPAGRKIRNAVPATPFVAGWRSVCKFPRSLSISTIAIT